MKNRMYFATIGTCQNPSLLLPSLLMEETTYYRIQKHRLLFPSVAFYYGRAIA